MRNNVARIRKEMNMTQTELAERLGLCKSALSHKELGKRDFTIEEALKIQLVLAVPFNNLFSLIHEIGEDNE